MKRTTLAPIVPARMTVFPTVTHRSGSFELASARSRIRGLFRLVLATLLAGGALAAQSLPVLERYSLQLGQTVIPGQSPGVELRLKDRFFGNGTAQARIDLVEESSSGAPTIRPVMLFLEVQRKVNRDEIAFALLVSGVEIRGFDAAGNQVYRRELPGFSFADSSSGRWSQWLAGLPTSLAHLVITFYGNYA